MQSRGQLHQRERVSVCAVAPSYQRTCAYWVLNAKREETREKRLAQLIADSANGERVRQFISPPGKGSKAKA